MSLLKDSLVTPIAGSLISVVLEPLLVLYEEGSSVEILLELRR